MKRLELLSVLKSVSPALPGRSLIPILNCLCFDSKSVVAYDDVVALKAPCDVGLCGGLPGPLLLAFLEASNSSEVVISTDENVANFKLGRSKMKIPIIPSEDFLFVAPKNRGDTLELTKEFLDSLSFISRSSAEDVHNANRSGITLWFEKGSLIMYATDAVTFVKISLQIPYPSQFSGACMILRERFHTLLRKISATRLRLTADGDIIGSRGKLRLYGKITPGADSSMYENMLTAVVPENLQFAKIPTGLSRCLERALLLNKETTRFSYADGRLEVFTEGGGSELRDSIKLSLDIPPIVVYTCAEYLLRYLDAVDFIGISDRCFVLKGDDCQVVVAVKL
jgi:hypothetical protein